MKYRRSLPLLIIAIIFFQSNKSTHQPPAGNVAYVRDEKEIRVIRPDGSGDQQLWTHKDDKAYSGIGDLAWSPTEKFLLFQAGMPQPSLFFIQTFTPLNQMVQDFANSPIPPAKASIQNIQRGKLRLQ